ncbi:MAG: hypothetical protein EZS28_018670 [Streblomastix strix]|uniref:Uncharacterized protein n=1 Tax=Streblomastix strix TaxID=222440 RepID=A0A5J4VU19_9EUKA|nr:MAG: hypothetical protein EZS28_018670 [Streblomastix strix]
MEKKEKKNRIFMMLERSCDKDCDKQDPPVLIDLVDVIILGLKEDKDFYEELSDYPFENKASTNPFSIFYQLNVLEEDDMAAAAVATSDEEGESDNEREDREVNDDEDDDEDDDEQEDDEDVEEEGEGDDDEDDDEDDDDEEEDEDDDDEGEYCDLIVGISLSSI